MTTLGIIAGSGAGLYPLGDAVAAPQATTRWGEPSAPLLSWRDGEHTIHFLRRHGVDGCIPPHRVNYRANVQVLADAGVDWVLASNVVGGIAPAAEPGIVVVPEQLIDYTWGREQSFYDGSGARLEHVDMTEPFDRELRHRLLASLAAADLPHLGGGVYGVTQGPRLETPAEIERMARDGCDIVGMTAMPEAGLAREAGLRYACFCPVVNVAAGRSETAIHADIQQWLGQAIEHLATILPDLLKRL